MQSTGRDAAAQRLLMAVVAFALTAMGCSLAAPSAAANEVVASSTVLANLRTVEGFVRSGVRVRGDLNLRQLDVAGPFRCRKCILEGELLATDARFRRTVDLSGSRIIGKAEFEGAVFAGQAVFGRGPGKGGFATFDKGANFAYVTFVELASFQFVRFEQADFSLTRFEGDAAFSGARFAGVVYFDSAQFSGLARLDATRFGRRASFRRAAFDGAADFSRARFERLAAFNETRFEQDGTFRGAEFRSACSDHAASFQHVLATKSLDLTDARFAGSAVFTTLSAGGLTFAGTQFSPSRRQTRRCHPGRGVALRGASVGDLVMPVGTATANVTDVPRTVLRWVEASAKTRGDLGLANEAHYKLRALESNGYWWPWHALDVVFYRWIAGYLVRPLRPLLTLALLALAIGLVRSAWRVIRTAERHSTAKREVAVGRTLGAVVARGGNEVLDTLTLIWPRRPDPQTSESTRLARRLEALAYRLLIVCVLLGVANSNPTLRQMLDAVL